MRGSRGGMVIAGLLSACASVTTPDFTLSGSGDPVLFVGNSHTVQHDVPGVLQALADSAGVAIAVAVVAMPNFALIDHWHSGIASEEIAGRSWKLVVLQQGWTPAGVCQDTLRLAVRHFAPGIEAVGARTALYQVWPPSDRPGQFQGTIESYRLAAGDVDGILLPVAEAWRLALARQPSLRLYSDAIHANETGAYLTALVMYTRIFSRSPVGLPATVTTRFGTTLSVPEETAALLQEVAAEVGLAVTPDEAPTAVPVITSKC